MPIDLNKVFKNISREAGIDVNISEDINENDLIELNQESLIQVEPELQESLVERAGEAYERPISVCFAGIGTFGANTLISFKEQNSENQTTENAKVDFLGIHSDGSSIKELEKHGFKDIIALSSENSGYLGTGGSLERGRELGELYFDQFKKRFKNEDLVLVVTGMGGGTGTGVAPLVAKAAKETQVDKKNRLTIGIATMPGVEEIGKKKLATQGIEELRKHVDALVIIDQIKVIKIAELESASIEETDEFIKAHFQIVLQSILDIVTKYTRRNIDFADVCSALKKSGDAIITTVISSSTNMEDIKKELVKTLNDKLLVEHSNKVASRLLIYPFYEEGYPSKNHYEIVGEVQKIFNWTKVTDESYDCILENIPDNTEIFSKVGMGVTKEKELIKIIVVAAGFIDKPQETTLPKSFTIKPITQDEVQIKPYVPRAPQATGLTANTTAINIAQTSEQQTQKITIREQVPTQVETITQRDIPIVQANLKVPEEQPEESEQSLDDFLKNDYSL